MPELPEVETIKNGIENTLTGAKITESYVNQRKLRIQIPDNFEEIVNGQTIENVKRRGKCLMMNLSNKWTILFHFGMSGTLALHRNYVNYGTEAYTPEKHEHVIFKYKNMDTGVFIFKDPRRFGLVDITPTKDVDNHPYIHKLGVEPLEEKSLGIHLYKSFKNKNIAVKKYIMENRILVGIGNIYASESLFDAGISPERKAKSLSKEECATLGTSIQRVLQLAIDAGGSSISDHRQVDGKLGYFQHNFKVYKKGGEPCLVCGTKIRKIEQSGRGTFYCPKCQQ